MRRFKEIEIKDKSANGVPWQYFPELKKACKMGVSDAKEVKFTTFTGRKNLIELKLIDGVPANKAAGMPFLLKKYSEYFWQ